MQKLFLNLTKIFYKMKTDLKKLKEETVSKSEENGLEMLFNMIFSLRQQINLRKISKKD